MKTIKIYLRTVDDRILKTDIDDNGKVTSIQSKKVLSIPSKKNQRTPIVNKKTGKTFLKFSEQYLKWKKLTKGFWEGEYWKLYNDKIDLPIDRCKINILFYFGDDKARDCTNKAETIMDALVEHGILADDSFQAVSEVSLKGFLCRDKPRTEIYITILERTDPGYGYDLTDYDKWEEQKKVRKKELRSFTPSP